MTDHPTFRPVALPTINPGGTLPWEIASDYSLLADHIRRAEQALTDAPCRVAFFPDDLGAYLQALADRREMFRLMAVVKAYAEAWEWRAAEAIQQKTPQAET